MDFSFDSETTEFSDVARRFCEGRVAKLAAGWDKGQTVDRSVFEEMGSLGLLRLRHPPKYGGLGASFVTCGRIAYEVGRLDVGLAIMVVNGVMFGEISHLMQPDVRDLWMPRVGNGSPFAIMLTEPGAGSDAGSIRTTARREGDHYIINGEKASVSYCGLADFGLIFARTGGPGPKGISLFLTPWDAPGIEKRVYDNVGERITQRGQVFFNNLKVPANHMIGSENGGFREAMQFFDYNRSFLSLMCIGAAEKSLEETIEHMKIRTTFGQPLSTYQGPAFQVAEHLTHLEMAKLLAYKVLWMKDNNIPHSREAAMIKWYGMEQAYSTIHNCLLLSGWPGYSSDLPHDKRMRDVLGLQLGDGTKEIMKMVIQREVFGREALTHRRSQPAAE